MNKTKVCNKCEIEKALTDYYKRKDGVLGVRPYCKVCCAALEKLRDKVQRTEYNKQHWAKNKEPGKERRQLKYANNREGNLLRAKENYAKDPERKKQYRRKYSAENKEIISAKAKVYHAENKPAILAYRRVYSKERKATDPLFKLGHAVRNRLLKILRKRNLKKTESLPEYLGCSVEALRAHLESQFQVGMTWDNRGAWHIDHIIPLSSAKTEAEIYLLCHYTNLQPLWAADNLKKGAKVT